MSWLTDSFDEPLTSAGVAPRAKAPPPTPRPTAPTIPPTPTPAAALPSTSPKPPPRYVFQDGQWIDIQAEESPSPHWMAESYARPVAQKPEPPKRRSVGEALRLSAEMTTGAAVNIARDKIETGVEVAKALGRGFTTSAENLLVHAPTALIQDKKSNLQRLGLLSPEKPEAIEQRQPGFGENWRKTVLDWTGTAQRFYEPEPSETKGDFFEQLRSNPQRTLEVGLAENVPQMLITLGASAVHPAVGLAIAGASENIS